MSLAERLLLEHSEHSEHSGIETVSPVARARATLRVIPGSAQRLGRGTFGLLVAGLLGAGLLIALLLNTVLAQGAFALHSLERESGQLAVSQQQLEQEVAALGTPQALQARAERLGMVPMDSPVFLRLRDGRVLGTAAPAAQAPTPTKPTKPTTAAKPKTPTTAAKSTDSAKPAAKPAAKAAAKPAGDGAVAVGSGR